MVSQFGCHGWALLRDMPLVLDLQTAMSVAAIVQPHREPTHPAVIPRRFGKGERLAHLALITQATGPVMTLHRTRIDDCGAEKIQDMLQTGFPMHDPHLYPLNPPPFILFLHLSIGPSLGPAADGTTGLACGAVAGGRIATSKGFEEGRLIALIGLGEDRRQMPRTETLLGIVHQGCGLRLGPFADDERHDQLAIGRNRGMVPQVSSLSALGCLTTLRLFFTTLHCSSHSKARGVTSRTRWSWKRSAWRPAIRSRRATVSGATWTRRAVARTPHPSPRWVMTDAACSSAIFVLNKAVPRRS